MNITEKLAREFSIKITQVENTVALIDDGNTIPFIARYRKEVTGSLDDQLLRELSDRLEYLRGLEKRKGEVLESIESQGKLTDELKNAIETAEILAKVEDLYRPYKQKRKTRGNVARERGLESLAAIILEQGAGAPSESARAFIDEEKGVATIDDAINGACDIIAEDVSDDAAVRSILREYIAKNGLIVSEKDKDEADEYKIYHEFSEKISTIPSHRVLALNRGEKDGALKVSISADENYMCALVSARYVKAKNECGALVAAAVEDGLDRLIIPSLEREIRNTLTENASAAAIKVFSLNLRQLLMQPPVKGCVTMGFDPAYRTGCKIAVIDELGKAIDTTVVYPTPPQNKKDEAKMVVVRLIKKYHVTAIAIGNGTASRESEQFVADLISELGTGIGYVMVNEAGASVYSASKLAAEEFPQYDVSLRSAVSIARRLQDPLAELVKIDPKSIGVGQYQHDMPQAKLSEALGGVVEDCVNSVGVNLNTASFSLLSHIAGINNTVAKNIVAYREENGAFLSRTELKKVPKLGDKAFLQCAGFLRIDDGKNPLDSTAVHPESYKAAKELLSLCGYKPVDVIGGGLKISERVKAEGSLALAEKIGIGEPTLLDIVEELEKPGRDPRDELPHPVLRSDVLTLDDITPGMSLRGTVRNVCDFGVFVDIGVHDDGLVHISKLCKKFIKHPSEVVRVGDIVEVTVLSVDKNKSRISLSMID